MGFRTMSAKKSKTDSFWTEVARLVEAYKEGTDEVSQFLAYLKADDAPQKED
jgi:hypothetical protein